MTDDYNNGEEDDELIQKYYQQVPNDNFEVLN